MAAEVVDLSQKGLRLICDKALPAGEPFFATLGSLRDDTTIEISGLVRWNQPKDNQRWVVGAEINPPIEQECVEAFAESGVLERRRSTRYEIRLPGSMRVEMDAELAEIFITDFSEGGMRMESPRALQCGERVLLDVADENRAARIAAQVVWCDQRPEHYVAGLSFNSRLAAETLREFCPESELRAANSLLNRFKGHRRFTSWIALLRSPFTLLALGAGLVAVTLWLF